MPVLSDYTAGTITLTNGSNAFTGIGTGWQAADFREGDTILGIEDHAGVEYVIATIDGNGSGTLTQDWEGATGTYQYRMRYLADGARVTAQARNLIELLGNGNLQALAGLTGPGVPVFNGPHSMTVRPETDFINGVAYNVQVDTLADRDAYDGQSAGFSVLVSDMGDGRSALFSKASNTSGDWTDPAYITGPEGPAPEVEATVDMLPPGSTATVTPTPITGGVRLDFELPSANGFYNAGEYDIGEVYAQDDVVSHNGSSFIALQAVPIGESPSSAYPPVDTAYWQVLAAKGADGSGSGDVTGPSGAVADRIAVFDGTTGKLIKDGGKTLAEVVPANNSITNAILADMDTARIKGRATAGTGDPEDLTAAQVRELLALSPAAFRATRSGALTASTGVAVNLQCGTEVFDTGGYYNNSTYRFTPPAGRYLLGGSVYFTTGVDQASLSLQIYKNGALAGYVAYARFPSNSGLIIIGNSLFEANGTDYFEFYAIQNSGGDLTIGDNPEFTYIIGTRLP